MSTRLPDYDYRYGGFFITLTTENRAPLFGQIVNGEVHRSQAGEIVAEEWVQTAVLRKEVTLDEWVVMPDHFHAIVFIDGSLSNGIVGGACWRPCQWVRHTSNDRIRSIQPVQRSLARMINQFKATVTKRINDVRATPGQPVWQRGYHDHVIRNEVELDKLRDYIRSNPLKSDR